MCLPSMHFVKRQVYFYMEEGQRELTNMQTKMVHTSDDSGFIELKLTKCTVVFADQQEKYTIQTMWIYSENTIARNLQFAIDNTGVETRHLHWNVFRYALSFAINNFITTQYYSGLLDEKKTHTKIKRCKRSKIARQK